jgi:hypothetical protein
VITLVTMLPVTRSTTIGIRETGCDGAVKARPVLVAEPQLQGAGLAVAARRLDVSDSAAATGTAPTTTTHIFDAAGASGAIAFNEAFSNATCSEELVRGSA